LQKSHEREDGELLKKDIVSWEHFMLSLINNSRVLTLKEHKIYDTLKRYMFTGKYSKRNK